MFCSRRRRKVRGTFRKDSKTLPDHFWSEANSNVGKVYRSCKEGNSFRLRKTMSPTRERWAIVFCEKTKGFEDLAGDKKFPAADRGEIGQCQHFMRRGH
jgi:hypothetical protein